MQQTFLQRAGDLVGETKPAAGSLQGLHVPSEDGPPPRSAGAFLVVLTGRVNGTKRGSRVLSGKELTPYSIELPFMRNA